MHQNPTPYIDHDIIKMRVWMHSLNTVYVFKSTKSKFSRFEQNNNLY